MRRSRRYRTITESVGSILVGFELIVVGLCGLAIFGLQLLPAPVALGGTAVALVLMVVTILVLRYPWGGWFCLGLQIVLTLCGFLHMSMFFVGGLFLITWIVLFRKSAAIDAERAPIIEAYEREQQAKVQLHETPAE